MILIIIYLVSICFEFLQGLFMVLEACKSVSFNFQMPQSWLKNLAVHCFCFALFCLFFVVVFSSNLWVFGNWIKHSSVCLTLHHMQQNCTI